METDSLTDYRMHKRRETMSDNRRYIIYYTSGENLVANETEIEFENEALIIETVNSDSETNSVK